MEPTDRFYGRGTWGETNPIEFVLRGAVIRHITAFRLDPGKAVDPINVIGRRIVARTQKEGLAAALPKVVHKAGHQLHGSALAAVFGAGVHVAEQPHASAFNGHHIGKGIAIAV